MQLSDSKKGESCHSRDLCRDSKSLRGGDKRHKMIGNAACDKDNKDDGEEMREGSDGWRPRRTSYT